MSKVVHTRHSIPGIVLAVTAICFCAAAAVGATHAEAVNPASDAQEEKDTRVVAVLFSVGQTENARKEFSHIANLDLLDINGTPMIMHVYNALCESRYIDKVVIVAAPEIEGRLTLRQTPETSFVIDRGDAAENIKFGIDEVSKGDLILFIPSDLVLVTPESIDHLIERVLAEKDIDIFFPLVSREACEKKYPEERRTYAHFKEGQYTGGHIEFLRPDLFLQHADQVQANKDNLYNLYSMRKSTLGMMRFLGLKLTLKYILGTQSPNDIEEHIYKKYHVRAKTLYWDDPDLATDLSEPGDIPMISRALEQRVIAHSHPPKPGANSVSGSDRSNGV